MILREPAWACGAFGLAVMKAARSHQAVWAGACGAFGLAVTKTTRSHHFAVLREAGLVEQHDAGPPRFNRLRRPEYDAAFPGPLPLVLSEPPPPGANVGPGR